MRKTIKTKHELLPCPFCGAKPKLKTWVANYSDLYSTEGLYECKKFTLECNQFTIKCSNDNFDTNKALCLRPSVTHCGPWLEREGTRGCETDEAAIEECVRLWNQRAE